MKKNNNGYCKTKSDNNNRPDPRSDPLHFDNTNNLDKAEKENQKKFE